MKHIGLLFLLLTGSISLWAQASEVQIKVYNFDDGLSHRNVFSIVQDSTGFLWMATINGLNRFDGYEFTVYSPTTSQILPTEMVSDLEVQQNGHLWLASPDFLTLFNAEAGEPQIYQIKEGDIVRRESVIPYNLLFTPDQRLWLTTYNEASGTNTLQIFAEGQLKPLDRLPGPNTQRPMAYFQNRVYVGAHQRELRWYEPTGALIDTYVFPLQNGHNGDTRIVALQALADQLYVLLSDGNLYYTDDPRKGFTLHPLSTRIKLRNPLNALLVEEDGDCWVGGLGDLWFYDARQNTLTDYDATIRQLTKNTAQYRQIMRDRSGAVWVASNFGAIRITRSEQLFTHYLSGGSEYCSNIYCSTRGITEDEKGNIYISYYNSIHVIDPTTEGVRPLFSTNDYFNFPFGILYHRSALYTGNGRRIDLQTFAVDTLIRQPMQDLGALTIDRDSQIWIGYQQSLYRYDPIAEKITEFSDTQGRWDSLAGTISYLHMGQRYLWVATADNGVFQLDPNGGRLAHFHSEHETTPLLSNRINAVYEDAAGQLWLATAKGLHRISADYQEVEVIGEEQGLPNAFINGLLSEGDSCFWLSTDNGLCRYSLAEDNCLNFFTTDGLSSNEFNRISFYKAKDGRMYFGGLNGVNAFYPNERFLERRTERSNAKLLLTQFTYLDGISDSLHHIQGSALQKDLSLSHRDRMFTIHFSLADYRQPGRNEYSYYLEGYDPEWSPPTTQHTIRYSDIPPGDYVFRARARAGRENWNPSEINLPIHIRRAYYQNWWFWVLMGLVVFGAGYGIVRYRLFLSEKRRHELEKEVRERTAELEAEKKKSEDLLLNILPAETAEELKQFGSAKAKRHNKVTVLFSDFKGFRSISEQLEPEELVRKIDHCFSAFDEITDRYGLEKIKTVGDAYLLVGGISGDGKAEALQVVRAALDIQKFMAQLKVDSSANNETYFEARIGIHTGPLVAGIVGIKKFAYDIWGDTVNIAARMESNGDAGKVNISEETLSYVKDEFECEEHGTFREHQAEIRMYWVTGEKDQ